MDDICEVIVTGPNLEWLTSLTKRLIANRLSACGQHLTEVRSIYTWDDQVQDEPEARVMLHTRRSLVPAIIEAVKKDHPYDVPCVLAVPIIEANPQYREWILAHTHEVSP